MKTDLIRATLTALSSAVYGHAMQAEHLENGVSDETNELYVICNLLDDIIRRLEILEEKRGGNGSC